MKDISRRVKNVEKRLNLNEEPETVTIVLFGHRDLPPDHTEGNMTIHYVMYDEKARQ